MAGRCCEALNSLDSCRAHGERIPDRTVREATPEWQKKLVANSIDFMQAMGEGAHGVRQLIADRNNGVQPELDREKEVDKAWDDTVLLRR